MAEKSKHLSIPPEIATRAGALEDRARATVDELHAGLHRSSFQSYAREVSGHRQAGNDDKRRQTNWKASARRGKFSLRQFDDGADLTVHLVVDGSASMKYGSAGGSKFEYAVDFAACLAYLTLLQEDPVQLSLFDEKIRESISAAKGPDEFPGLMERVAAWEPGGPTGIGGSIVALANDLRHGGLVILLSDFFEETETWMEAVERIRFHGNEVILIQVLDPEEMEFPFDELLEFEAMEGGEKFKIHGAEVRDAYLGEIKLFFEKMREVSARSECHYLLADSSKPLAGILESYLTFRRQARRL